MLPNPFTGDDEISEEQAKEIVVQSKKTPTQVDFEKIIPLLQSDDKEIVRHGKVALRSVVSEQPQCVVNHDEFVTEVLRTPGDLRLTLLQGLVQAAQADPTIVTVFESDLLNEFEQYDQNEAMEVGTLIAHAPRQAFVETAVSEFVSNFRDQPREETGATVRAIISVGKAHPDIVIPELIPLLSADNAHSELTRKYAVHALSLLADPHAEHLTSGIDQCVRLLDASDGETRKFALRLLEAVATTTPTAFEPHVDKLFTVLTEGDGDMEKDVLSILTVVARQNPSVFVGREPTLREIVETGWHLLVRDALYILGVIHDDASKSVFEEFVNDGNPEQREIARRALNELNGDVETPLREIPPSNVLQHKNKSGTADLTRNELEEIRQDRLRSQ